MAYNPAALIEKLITEHGSASILKERLLLLRDQLQALELENERLQSALAYREKENAELKRQIAEQAKAEEFVEHEGALFKRRPGGGYHKAVYCPYCRAPLGSLEGVLPYNCGRCKIMLDFTGEDLARIMGEIAG